MSLDEYYLRMAFLAAQRGTCARRQVGCVLADEDGRVLTIGYNGVPPGLRHCTETPCAGARLPRGMKTVDQCGATHAEQSALIACADISRVRTCYTTVSPCFSCVKLLLQTKCERVVFAEEYNDSRPRDYWESSGRTWRLMDNLTGLRDAAKSGDEGDDS